MRTPKEPPMIYGEIGCLEKAKSSKGPLNIRLMSADGPREGDAPLSVTTSSNKQQESAEWVHKILNTQV